MSGTFRPLASKTMSIPREHKVRDECERPIHHSHVFHDGPWKDFPVPAGPRGTWSLQTRLWAVRLHDDPFDFKPVFVDSVEPPRLRAPATPLGYYALTTSGWRWSPCE